jgi:hypothetical protein
MKILAELIETGPLAWWLEKKLQKAKFPVSKNLGCADSAYTLDWMAWNRKKLVFVKHTAQQKQGFEFKVT